MSLSSLLVAYCEKPPEPNVKLTDQGIGPFQASKIALALDRTGVHLRVAEIMASTPNEIATKIGDTNAG